jgi:hypothetical protein
MASGAALLDQNIIFCYDTLHVVGSWYDPATCKVSASRTGEKSFGKKKTAFDHLGRSHAPASARIGQNVGIQPFVSGDTLHVVGSWHDPTTWKVSASRTSDKPFGKKKKTFDHFVRFPAAGGAQDGQNVARNLMVSVDTLHAVGSW